MAGEANQLMEHLSAVEEMAEEILSDRQQIVNLDRKRNHNREAMRALTNEIRKEVVAEDKSWVCFGNMFMKMDKKEVHKQLIEDQVLLDKEIDKLRNGLKPKLDKLRDIEGKPELQGFHLQPLSNQEMMAVNPMAR